MSESKISYELLTPHEAAIFLGVSLTTLQNWRYLKKGPDYIKLEGYVRYKMANLMDFVENSEVKLQEINSDK